MRPSPLHRWRFLSLKSDTQWCDRCARSFVPLADTRGPVECVPTSTWIATHPTDTATR